MTKRNTQQRRHLILTQVNELGEVAVEKLAEQFQTSEVTIRKDLTSLEKSGPPKPQNPKNMKYISTFRLISY